MIKARGSSAASAANAVVDSLRSASFPTPGDDWFSAGVVSDGSYGIPAGLVSTVPLRSDGKGNHTIVEGLEISDYARDKLQLPTSELLSERSDVSELL